MVFFCAMSKIPSTSKKSTVKGTPAVYVQDQPSDWTRTRHSMVSESDPGSFHMMVSGSFNLVPGVPRHIMGVYVSFLGTPKWWVASWFPSKLATLGPLIAVGTEQATASALRKAITFKGCTTRPPGTYPFRIKQVRTKSQESNRGR